MDRHHPRTGRTAWVAALACVLGAALWPAGSLALVVTVGTPTAGFLATMSQSSCSGCTQYQEAAPGYQLTVPADGAITTWRVAGDGPLALRVLRGPSAASLTAVTTSPAAGVARGTVGAFAVSLPVLAGDRIGVNLGGSSHMRFSPLAMGTYRQAQPAPADGAAVTAPSSASGALNLNADVAIAPVATALDVASGSTAGGTAVTITGSYLDGVTSVLFGGAGASFTLSGSALVVTAPARSAPGPVDVEVRGPGGATTLAGAFTYLAPPPTPIVSPPAGTAIKPALGRPITGAPASLLAVVGLSLAPSAFRAAPAGPSLSTAPVGARLAYSVAIAARTRFAVGRAATGLLVRGHGGRGGACQPARSPVPATSRCTRYVALGAGFSHADRAGRNVMSFTGRLGGRPLAPGSYRLSAFATDAGGNRSATVTHAFRILPPR